MTEVKMPEHSTKLFNVFGVEVSVIAYSAEQMKQYGDDRAREALDVLQARITDLEAIEKQQADTIVWQAGEIAKHLDTIEASRKQGVAQPAVKESLTAQETIAKWARSPEPEQSKWHEGYEAARAWVHVQMQIMPFSWLRANGGEIKTEDKKEGK